MSGISQALVATAAFVLTRLAPGDPTLALREERRYVRLLLAMVVAVVLAGFVLGILGNLFGGR